MSTGIRRLANAWMLSLLLACVGQASRSSTESASRTRSDTITREEMARGAWPNAYVLVEQLRPRWLRTHGADNLTGQPVPVRVHIGDVRAGGVSALREISVRDIEALRFVDPISAAGRWGLDHGNGAIVVTLRTR